MRRLISWLIMVPAAVAVVIFALNNKDSIALNLWPFAMVIEMELYLVLTAVLGAGVVLGGITSWAGAGRIRSELRKQSYAGEVARRELKSEREKRLQLEADLRALKNLQVKSAAMTLTPGAAGDAGDNAKTIEHGEAASTKAQLPSPQNAA